jgi:tetratricopeptide (TPR) repeat protein
LSAAELVLRGHAVWNESQTLASVKEARGLFDAALRLDPNLVSALVARSSILDAEKDVDPNADRDRIVREMEDFSGRALKRDISNPQVWRARGLALAVGGHWNAALEAADQTIKLDPYNPQRHVDKAWLLNMTGRPADALPVIDQAMAMTPSYTGWGTMVACWAHLLLGHADQAVTACEKAAGSYPDWSVQFFSLLRTPTTATW